MLFRRKKEEDESLNLIDVLRENPEMIYVGDQFMAVYSPGLDQALVIHGDFSELNEEEVNTVLQVKLKEYMASLN